MGRINMCLLSSYADSTGKPLPVKGFFGPVPELVLAILRWRGSSLRGNEGSKPREIPGRLFLCS